MNPIYYVAIAALIVLVLYRQVTGRFVRTPSAMVRLPLIFIALGVFTLVQAHPPVTAIAVLLAAADLVITAGLGVARAAAVRLELRDGWLYQRGGVPMLLLWVLTIGVRVGFAVLAEPVAGPLLTATTTVSVGLSLLVQAALLARRVRADGRPIRPGVGRDADSGHPRASRGATL